MLDYDHAPSGEVRLETALGVVLTVLHHNSAVPLACIVEMLTIGSARAFSIPCGTRSLIPHANGPLIPNASSLRARNTPFSEWKLRGRVAATFARKEVFRAS
jgi:dihydroorotase-like cyclic amidohydrolase